MQQAVFQIVNTEYELVENIKIDPEYSLLVPIEFTPKQCPHCGCREFLYHADRRCYQCKECGRQVE